MKRATCSVHYMPQPGPRHVQATGLHWSKASHTQHLFQKYPEVFVDEVFFHISPRDSVAWLAGCGPHLVFFFGLGES